MAEQQEYKLPTPGLDEQHYAYATVIELQRIRIALEALAAAMQNPPAPPPGEVILREPEAKPKPKRCDP